MKSIGSYRYSKNPIGIGAFSRVYRGEEIYRRTPVAIKHTQLTHLEPKARQQLISELEIAKNLHHPNVIRTYDVINCENDCYLIMELCTAGTLSDVYAYLKTMDIEDREPITLYYLRQLMEALKYLQSQSILHRDLKPMNILLSGFVRSDYSPETELVVKLSDYGLAKMANSDLHHSICGSPIYMAPEIILDQKYGNGVDLWSFGVIMYEMLYGINPFPAKSLGELIRRHQHPELKIRDGPSPEAQNLIRGLLQTNPEKRISWDEFYAHPWFAESVKNPSPHGISVPMTIPRKFEAPIRILSSSLRLDDLRRSRDEFVFIDSNVPEEPHSLLEMFSSSLSAMASKLKNFNSY